MEQTLDLLRYLLNIFGNLDLQVSVCRTARKLDHVQVIVVLGEADGFAVLAIPDDTFAEMTIEQVGDALLPQVQKMLDRYRRGPRRIDGLKVHGRG